MGEKDINFYTPRNPKYDNFNVLGIKFLKETKSAIIKE